MRDATVADLHRLVLDESSFDLRGHSREQVVDAVEKFGDLLADLRHRDQSIAVWSALYEVECDTGLLLHDLLFDAERSPLPRDVRARLASALTKLPAWDDTAPADVPLDVEIDGGDPVFAPTIGYAVLAAARRHGVACAVLPLARVCGQVKVATAAGTTEIHFFAEAAELTAFWRTTMVAERITETEYFRRWALAFPSLVRHDSLSFSAFDGDFAALCAPVTTALSAINDQFVTALADAKGQPHEVERVLRTHGVVATRESVKTRGSPRHMAMRDVEHAGRIVRCEWHAKLEPHRNRIHFSLPLEGGRVLIGLFVEHLATA
ncbi:hypothetical protein GCM10022243_26840 [Saccharothrix violaceirubra]|uniref:Uncharacterized protein n=1 Tax=Saccharothrix violaceirubra TaxID=413306 RepID=A0A7W7WZB2_9PSEU|nr:hypothetical protein [Saccharothrix violaceirubra]MBB4969394.1 hypothetical protein [Saccharothrix violaceirubra]